MRQPPASVQLVDTSRRSGAFNILEQIQRSNDFVQAADSQFQPIPFTIYWSERNQRQPGSIKDGMVGTTYFNLATSTAYVLGDRNTDSDEFDDSVLIHEYAHMLAAKFSRDDSIGEIAPAWRQSRSAGGVVRRLGQFLLCCGSQRSHLQRLHRSRRRQCHSL
jgi:hypothetical protein